MNYAVNNYLLHHDIQLEHTDSHGLMQPLSTTNPYTATLQKAVCLAEIVGKTPLLYFPISAEEAVTIVENAYQAYEQRNKELRALEDELKTMQERILQLQNFASILWDVSQLRQFAFTHYCFGKLPITHFLQYEKFLAEDEKTIFVIAKRDKYYVWGVYFSPIMHKDAVDTVFTSLKFEPINIFSLDENITGNPETIIKRYSSNCINLEHQISTLTHSAIAEAVSTPEQLSIACYKVKNLYKTFDLERFASISSSKQIFSFSGWITAEDAIILEAETDVDNLIILDYYENNNSLPMPPTLLKNPPIVRQFEFFTRLYGVPKHGEIDPTPFLAVTYTILFGLMFGDVGHGLVLTLLGLFMRRKWGNSLHKLGGIMATAGVSAMVFGFLYGSIFGFEDILPALWRRPGGDISATLIFAAGLGVILITLSILINMYISFKRRDISEFLFGANGAAGLVFYGAMIFILLRILVFGLPVSGLVVAVAQFPLIFIIFKHPLERFMDGRKLFPAEGIGQLIFNTIIELFETLLTYATNTISFVRVGAFAISHAGMMHIVLQLSQGAAGQATSEARNWLIVVLGNVLVLVIEGLLVGIQVLRLEFYEMFSRFYTGGGRSFMPNKLH